MKKIVVAIASLGLMAGSVVGAGSANAESKFTSTITIFTGYSGGVPSCRSGDNQFQVAVKVGVGSKVIIKSDGKTVAIGRISTARPEPTGQITVMGLPQYDCYLVAKVKVPQRSFYKILIDGVDAGEYSKSEMKKVDLKYGVGFWEPTSPQASPAVITPRAPWTGDNPTIKKGQEVPFGACTPNDPSSEGVYYSLVAVHNNGPIQVIRRIDRTSQGDNCPADSPFNWYGTWTPSALGTYKTYLCESGPSGVYYDLCWENKTVTVRSASVK